MAIITEPIGRFTTAREFIVMLLPLAGMLIALGTTLVLPNVYPEGYEPNTYSKFLFISMGVWVLLMLVSIFLPALRKRCVKLSPIIMVLYLTIDVLDILTLKTGILELPFIPSPDKTIESFFAYPDKVIPSFFASMELLFEGFTIGCLTGFFSGVIMGWSRICDYWLQPILKLVGPVPSAAWLPIAVVIMPSNRAAGLFLIALSVWFPLALMLSSAIRNTDKKQVETARVLGASDVYILLHVALPAALPTIFDALFMGLSGSFGGLVIAEMLGVKSGLGWYLTWAKSWSDYGRVFATTGMFIIIFFVLIQLLFFIRDRVMKWQKGLVRW